MHKILVHAQHSCACTTLLCMHWRGQGPTKKQPPWAWPAAAFLFGSWPWSLAHPVHAQECCAYTRVLCMHKNLVHAQESCACTIYLLFLHNNKYCSETFPYQTWDFLAHVHLHNRLRRIPGAVVKFCRTTESILYFANSKLYNGKTKHGMFQNSRPCFKLKQWYINYLRCGGVSWSYGLRG